MKLFKGIFKAFGTVANDSYTEKKIKGSNAKAYAKVGNEYKEATKKGIYLGKTYGRRKYRKYRDAYIKKAVTYGKARDRFLDSW